MIKNYTPKSKSEIPHQEEKVTYVGVDLSKSKLDVMSDKYRIYPNSDSGCKHFCRDLKQKSNNVVVVYEATGSISLQFAAMLDMNGIQRCQVSPRKIRHFAKGGIKEAKTKQVLSDCRSEFARKTLNDKIKADKEQRKLINAQLHRLIKEDEYMGRKMRILMQEIGVGKETAVALALELPELGNLSRKEVAALVGVAPFNFDSGNKIGKRYIRYGRRNIRNLLYMCTRAALNAKTENVYHKRWKQLERKVKNPNSLTNAPEDKDYKRRMVACMRLMIVRLNAITRDWIAEGCPDITQRGKVIATTAIKK